MPATVAVPTSPRPARLAAPPTAAAYALVFGLVGLPCTASWVLFGTALRQALHRPAVLRAFNLVMGALLIASLYPALTE